MARTAYASNVFFNCPFDKAYDELRDALVFAIYDCGFVPRCALEEDDGGVVRFEKFMLLSKNQNLAFTTYLEPNWTRELICRDSICRSKWAFLSEPKNLARPTNDTKVCSSSTESSIDTKHSFPI